MMRSVLPLSIAAAFGLSACGSDPNTMGSRAPRAAAAPAAAPAATLPYRAGSGVVQSVTAAPRAASAGGTTPVTTTRGDAVSSAGATGAGTLQRLAIRMDDGRVQYVDMAGAEIPAVGTRVQLTPDHQIIRQ
jgi:hypothetical protein